MTRNPPAHTPSPRRRATVGAWLAPLAALAAVAAIVWWFVFRESPAERGARLLREANVAMQARDFLTAEERLQAALKLAPQNALLHHNLAVLYVQQKRPVEARAAFERAAAACGPEVNQVRAEEYFQLATLSFAEKKPAQAARELELAIEAHPSRLQLHTRLLDLQLGPLADSTAAAATTERLLVDCGRTPRHLTDAGYVHYQHRSYIAAAALAQAAVAMRDSFPEGHALLARSLGKQGRMAEGLRGLDGPLERYPRAHELWVAKSLLSLDVGLRKPALEAANRAVSLAPRDFEAHQARQKALAGDGQLQEALAEIEIARGLAADPAQLQMLQRQESFLRRLLGQAASGGEVRGPGAADPAAARP